MTSLGQFGPARCGWCVLLTLVLGIAYPLVVTGIAQVAFPLAGGRLPGPRTGRWSAPR